MEPENRREPQRTAPPGCAHVGDEHHARTEPGALALQRQVGNRAVSDLITGKITVSRVRIDEYDKAMSENEGVTTTKALEAGWLARNQRSNNPEPPDDRARVQWEVQQKATLSALLAPVRMPFAPNDKAWKAAQIIVGGLANGHLQPPPDIDQLLKVNAPLFRGTTRKIGTNTPYVGNPGSRVGSPTTPGPIQAALFAIKGATEHHAAGAEGVVVWGSISTVQDFGFLPPDTMAGQEQEVTVNEEPQTVNQALGTITPLTAFREALEFFGVTLPQSLTPGVAFDNLLKNARSFTPEELITLQALLHDDDRRTQALKTRAESGELLTQLDSLRRRAERVQLTVPDDASLRRTVMKAPSLETLAAAVEQLRSHLTKLQQSIETETTARQANRYETSSDQEEEFKLFD